MRRRKADRFFKVMFNDLNLLQVKKTKPKSTAICVILWSNPRLTLRNFTAKNNYLQIHTRNCNGNCIYRYLELLSIRDILSISKYINYRKTISERKN